MDSEFEQAVIAIYSGDEAALRSQLEQTTELATKKSSCGHPTLLQLVASEAKDLPKARVMTEILVGHGAETWFPIVSAAGCGSTEVLKQLLDNDSEFDTPTRWTPLDEALYWNQKEATQILLNRGSRIRALSTAAGLGDLNLIETFFEDSSTLGENAGPIMSPFPETVEVEQDQQVILDHAFVMAINNGQLEAAELILNRGAAINATPPGYHWKGSALHAAVWRGERSLVAWLLENGADPKLKDGLVNADAIGWANHHGHPELTDLLETVS